MSKLFLDFETKDMAIQESLGSGWCYKDKLEILGYAYAVDDSEVNWSHDIALLESLVNNSSEIICHNANYDIGILKMLNIPYLITASGYCVNNTSMFFLATFSASCALLFTSPKDLANSPSSLFNFFSPSHFDDKKSRLYE